VAVIIPCKEHFHFEWAWGRVIVAMNVLCNTTNSTRLSDTVSVQFVILFTQNMESKQNINGLHFVGHPVLFDCVTLRSAKLSREVPTS
jgi:hypothetical protein